MGRRFFGIAVLLALTISPAVAQTAWPRWGQSPLPSTFASLPEAQRKLSLARRYVDALHMGWFFTKAVNRNWQPLEDAFRAKAERSLSGPALSHAMSDFEHALDATRIEQMNKRSERLAQYFATNMSEAGLKAAAEFYASALGQRMVLSPDTVSPEDRREQGRLMLANPALMQATTVQLRFAASDHVNVEKARLEFAHDFQARLCAAFQRDRISAKLCSPENSIKGG